MTKDRLNAIQDVNPSGMRAADMREKRCLNSRALPRGERLSAKVPGSSMQMKARNTMAYVNQDEEPMRKAASLRMPHGQAARQSRGSRAEHHKGLEGFVQPRCRLFQVRGKLGGG